MPSYLKLVDDLRIRNYLGLAMDEGKEYKRAAKMSQGYAFIEIPIRGLVKDGELVQEGLRNQYLELQAAATVEVKGNYRFEVHPNPALLEYGMTSGMYYLEPDEGRKQLSTHIWLRKDLDLSKIDYAVRIYMRD